MNTDQSNQFTSEEWIKPLKEAAIQISMDGRGRCLDNIFVERLWRSLKPETIYLYEINNGFQAWQLINDWVIFTTGNGLIRHLHIARPMRHIMNHLRFWRPE